MNALLIVPGASYEDRGETTIRTVTQVKLTGYCTGIVEYVEHRLPGYWPGRKIKHCSLKQFLMWAERPAGTKDLPPEEQFACTLLGQTDWIAASKY